MRDANGAAWPAVENTTLDIVFVLAPTPSAGSSGLNDLVLDVLGADGSLVLHVGPPGSSPADPAAD